MLFRFFLNQASLSLPASFRPFWSFSLLPHHFPSCVHSFPGPPPPPPTTLEVRQTGSVSGSSHRDEARALRDPFSATSVEWSSFPHFAPGQASADGAHPVLCVQSQLFFVRHFFSLYGLSAVCEALRKNDESDTNSSLKDPIVLTQISPHLSVASDGVD